MNHHWKLSLGSNKSQGSQKSIAKPKPKQPVVPEQPSNLVPRQESKHVKEDELTPFHEDALSSAGSLATPDVTGSSAGGWTVHASGNVHLTFATFSLPKLWATCWEHVILHHQTQTATLDQWVATAATHMLHSKTARKKKSAMQQLTSSVPIDEIPESVQEGAVLAQPDAKATPVNTQVAVAEPAVEAGPTPGEEDPQPDGVVSSKDADFVKAESEQVLPSI